MALPRFVYAADMTIKNNVLVKYRTDSGAVSVSVPYGVVAIANEAFSGDTSLEEIEIPSTVKKIGDRAFYNCNSLNELNLPEGVETLGESAFSHCTSLKKVYIPGTVKTVGNGVFAGATSLEDITVAPKSQYFFANDGVLYSKYSTKLIQYAAGKTQEVYDMPFTVHEVAPYAFWGADKLKAIYVSNNVEDIEPFSFANAKGLEAVFLPNSVGSIQQYAFRDDYNLRLVGVEEDNIDIHSSAFAGCATNLKPTRVSSNIDLVKTAEKIKLESVNGEKQVVGKVVQSKRENGGSDAASSDSAKRASSTSSEAQGDKTESGVSNNNSTKKKSASDNSSESSSNASSGTKSTARALPGNGYAYVPTPGSGKVYEEGRTVGVGRIDRNYVYIVPVH